MPALSGSRGPRVNDIGLFVYGARNRGRVGENRVYASGVCMDSVSGFSVHSVETEGEVPFSGESYYICLIFLLEKFFLVRLKVDLCGLA